MAVTERQGTMADDSTNVLELIGRIYDAAGERSAWGEVAVPIAEAIGARYGWLMMTDPLRPHDCWVRSGKGRDIFGYRLDQGPWYPAVRRREPGDVILGSEQASREDVRSSPLYEELLRPRRLEFTSIVLVERTEHNEHFFSFNRTSDQGDFSPESQRLLALLAPHLRRGYALHTRLYSPFAFPQRIDPGLVDSLTAVFLLDRYNHVRWLNPAAERVLRKNDGVRVRDGRLVLDDARAARELERDLQLSRLPPRHSGSSVSVVHRCRRRSAGLPFAFSVTPQNPSISCLRFDCAAASCVLIDDLEESPAPSTLSLESVFQLTRSEAQVARQICRGLTVSEIAARRKVSVDTVRTQLKRVMAKCGAHSQGDLIRRVAGLARSGGGRSGAAQHDDC